jgi:hypothetical protein
VDLTFKEIVTRALLQSSPSTLTSLQSSFTSNPRLVVIWLS